MNLIYTTMMNLLQTSSGRTSDYTTASFGAKELLPMKNGWNPSEITQGQIHHNIGHLMPSSSQQDRFISMYSMILKTE